ncbi:uncharacterized protein cubi_01343 [Cryptosporidium ubiquitum]|uniref:Uncharacterized protein n=1 Tax=Cryptosporidium ubiquitum TaxID=857276 RepID=A0A1J4MCP7_9CRYT|nr:uncharacterized protein cubi_01343 [Cryptosporidium ubiquitum]OII72010.1 hypothetical protein cubi_01343 [Cryptosporidium ubiquitum]
MNQLSKEIKLCGVYECNYTNTGGEIIHISPTNNYYSDLNINEEVTKVLLPYYIDVNFDGINQFESQYHIVLRFNNTSDNIMVRLNRMYIVHEGIPVQVHNLNCYLLGKTTKISNDMKLSLLGSSSIKNKSQYFKSIRVVIKIDNLGNEEINTGFSNKNSIRILLDYFVDFHGLIASINVIQSDIKNINFIRNSPIEESEETFSETCSEDHSFAPILMPTMGHR